MKKSINGSIWSGIAKSIEKKYDWKTFIKDAADAGYDGVEIGGTKETLGKPQECLHFIQDHGLEIAAFATSVTYNPYQPNTEAYQKAMDYAASLGVTTISVCGGFIPNPRRNTYPFDYDIFSGNLGNAMEYAAKQGLQIAFHPHRGCIVETLDEANEMVKRLPGLTFCIDTAHLEAFGQDAEEFIRVHGDKCAFTHIKDYSWEQDSFVMPGEGDSRLRVGCCIQQLLEKGYDGWFSIELDRKWPLPSPEPVEVAQKCLQFLRNYGN